ncbi:hypothetical protein TL18_05480 [Methanobrevibacter sp. YE315]|uniref:UPF0280 family protein n=1 Tax=Methanobrevibacter sp. YE315 TaxID=1609968 RepID=UPI000764EBA4|nr:UPF0280 family protein [Methanobrevibacter sp. YE315]AMD17520.1 hypothetical protein TL18_05480 [Methanobrevibacter sp. YE315]
MNHSEINLEETHIRLTTDLVSHELKKYIQSIRYDLKEYISRNSDFLLSLEPIETEGDLPLICETMVKASNIADVGPMACVAGSISELSLNYLINLDSKYSIVENGGDIALINDEKVLCGIYSNNEILKNKIAFEVKARKKPLGICTSSGRIGHSISFGDAESVSVISKSAATADGLATKIANEVKGSDSEDMLQNALEFSENYKEFFEGVLIISGDHVATMGKLPRIVETDEFNVDL